MYSFFQNGIFKLAKKLFCLLRAFLHKLYYYIAVLLSYEGNTSRHMIGILSYNDMSLLPETVKKSSSQNSLIYARCMTRYFAFFTPHALIYFSTGSRRLNFMLFIPCIFSHSIF